MPRFRSSLELHPFIRVAAAAILGSVNRASSAQSMSTAMQTRQFLLFKTLLLAFISPVTCTFDRCECVHLNLNHRSLLADVVSVVSGSEW